MVCAAVSFAGAADEFHLATVIGDRRLWGACAIEGLRTCMEAEATAGRKREARAATLRSISSFYRGMLSLFVKDEGGASSKLPAGASELI